MTGEPEISAGAMRIDTVHEQSKKCQTKDEGRMTNMNKRSNMCPHVSSEVQHSPSLSKCPMYFGRLEDYRPVRNRGSIDL